MQTEKKFFVPLFITFVMVVGAFAALVPAPGTMSAVGDRESNPFSKSGEMPEPTTLGEFMKEQEALQPEMTNNLLVQTETERTASEVDGVVQPSESSAHIEVTVVNPSEGTRSPGVDAGGPYGGPDTMEGTWMTFTATVDDPTLIFFRWDLDDDGVPETDWELSLTMSHTIDWFYDDNYFGDIVVEAWDGVSTKTLIYSGNVLDESQAYSWIIYPATQGVKFTARKALTIGKLGFNPRGYYFSTRYMDLWDVDTQTLLRQCTPGNTYNNWNWCSITPYTLNPGHDYIVSIYKYSDYSPYIYGPYFTAVETDTDNYKIQSSIYLWSYWGGHAYPYGDAGSGSWYPFVDFEWSLVEIIPDPEVDTAFLEVNNAAPTPSNIQTSPPMIYEGADAAFTAEFDDVGTGDDWWYSWDFGDGDTSPWVKVNKMLGGARVLFIQAYVGGQEDPIIDEVREIGGDFFTVWDEWVYGPLGSVPSLETMLNYDVILIGSNYYVYEQAYEVGDNLADFMDMGGAVVALTWCCNPPPGGGIAGRFTDDDYLPVELAVNYYGWTYMDTILVPGHEVFNGVTEFSTYYSHQSSQLTDGAIALATYTNGYIAAAEKTNPIVNNGAISFFINFALMPGNVNGDYSQFIANAIIYASQADQPVPKTMPITTEPVSHRFRDDDPDTTSPWDEVEVTVRVKDDDHEMLEGGYETLLSEDCSGYNYPSMPPGWTSTPGYYGASWRIYINYYMDNTPAFVNYYNYDYYNPSPTLSSPSFDLSTKPWVQATFGFRHDWYAYTTYDRDGFVEMSDDGGATWTILDEFHSQDPQRESMYKTYDIMGATGSSDVQFRWRIERTYMYAYYWWIIDDVWIEAAWGTPIEGLGEDSDTIVIVNVEPGVGDGPPSGQILESDVFDFVGYKIKDPALWEPTEWFAYKWNFDDGTGTDWVYKGSLGGGKLDVLVLHTCYGNPSCITNLQNAIDVHDITGYVEYWDFLGNPPTYEAPTLDYMQDFDVIVVTILYGYGGGYAPWDVVRRTLGDNLADYVDSGRGGVITEATLLSCIPNVGWCMYGRYADDDYGPFEFGTYVISTTSLDEVHYPEHQIMKGKYEITDVTSSLVHTGDHDTTPDGIRLASWADGGAFVGARIHPNGARVVHFGGAGGADIQAGASGQYSELMSNMLVWSFGSGMPTDDIFPISHQFGDNGVYDVDITLIDDDMGWTWDIANNMPVAHPSYPQTESHVVIPISVDNVDPMISTQSIEVYIPAQFCLRVSGTSWHQVSMSVLKDAMFWDEVVLERQPGDPNDQALCSMVKVDLKGSHTYSYALDYIPLAGESGSNPSWVIISPWKEPITPGHGRVTHKHDFETNDPSTWNVYMDLPTLSQDLMDNGHGAEIAFEASALDYGTDDLAFVWVWGDSTPYGMHVHHNNGMPVSEGINTNPENVGFTDPWFDVGANNVRSPFGTVNFLAHDIAYHMFEQGYYYYVTLIVMDDDVNDPYPSPYGHPGSDMEFIVLDLR